MPKNNINKEDLLNYLCNELDSSEVKEIEAALQEDDNLRGQLEDLKQIRMLHAETMLPILNEPMSDRTEALIDTLKDKKSFSIASIDELEQIEGVGPIVAKEIVEFWSNQYNFDMTEECFARGVNFQEKNGVTSNRLTGKIFVFTGSLEKLNRRDAKEIVEELGGRSSSTISKKTNFVVAGSNAGTKLNKAKKFGIQIINEDEFLILTKNK